MKNKFKIIVAVVSVISFVFIFLYEKGYVINLTASFPLGIYKKISTIKSLKRNDLVLFCPPNKKIFKFARNKRYLNYGICPGGFIKMMKKAAGLPGDHIIINKYVYINGIKQKNSLIYREDSQGNILPKIKENMTLNKDEYFMMSDYDIRSFDSRYFGKINKKQFIAIMKEILIF